MRQDICDRTFKFATRIVRFCKSLVKEGANYRVLSNQLLRSATSIGANMEEAVAGQSKADFVSKCSIVLKEARETKYWLRLLIETNLLPDKTI